MNQVDFNSKSHQNNGDAVRFILACLVMSGHTAYTFFHAAIPLYVVAVPIFLGLSGFLIPTSIERSTTGQFLWNRFLRIYPLLTVVVILGSIAFHARILDCITVLCTLGTVHPSKAVNFISQGWSIGAEEIMYAAALGLAAVSTFKTRWALWLAWVLMFAVAIAGDYVLVPAHRPFMERIVTLPSAFFVGALVRSYTAELSKAKWIFWVCGGLAVVVMMLSLTLNPHPGLPGLPDVLIAQLLTVVALGLSFFSKPIFAWWKAKVGDLSYGVYLLHLSVLFGAVAIGLRGWLGVCVVVVTSLLLARLSWSLLESNALKYKNRLPHLPKRTREPKIVEVAA